ncbi:2-hydroxyacid dehydrogenase [Palleronia sp. KMU-117]|uniref:2-hydroxyacid dehydrogenase n=1 Tax=Palleronia sp. KMU-117 TaxID=3434108 RepID=UPI003D727531
MKPTLLITRALPEAVLDRARAHFDVTLHDKAAPLTEAEAAAALATYDAILPTLGDGFRGRAFDGGPHRCKVLANFGVGYNHIDVAAAKSAGLIVTNTPGAVTDATADIALTLILMVCRRAGEGERRVRAGQWRGWAPTQLLGTHVTGRTVGIIGMGRIGKAIARRCHFGFEMEVIYYNRSQITDPHVPGMQIDSLTDLLQSADIAVLAVPATPETKHLIGPAELRALGPRSYLVNIARGDVVDEAALVTALKDGTIAGAGLDVYEREPELAPGLTECENAVLLPHLGTAALEVREAMGFMALANAEAVVEGRQPPNPV